MFHKWKIEITGNRNVEIACKPMEDMWRGSESRDKYKLKFGFEVNEEERRNLIEEGTTNMKSEVEFKSLEDGNEMWPFTEGRSEVTMVIFIDQDLSQVVVKLYNGEDDWKPTEFYCGAASIGEIRNEDIEWWEPGDLWEWEQFVVEATSLDNKTLKNKDEENLEDMALELGECRQDGGEKKALCDLKVVTGFQLIEYLQNNY